MKIVFTLKHLVMLRKMFTLKSLYTLNIIFLSLSFFELPYSYYQFLRWFVCLSALYSTKKNSEKTGVSFISLIIAILFNPLEPFYIKKSIWLFIDVLVIIFYICNLINFNSLKNKIKNYIIHKK